MPKTDPPHPDDTLSLRRRRAAEEEAEALRAEVVRWVREGEAGRQASDALRDLFREGLEGAVRDALADGEVARSLAGDLRGELAGVFEEEIRDEVARQVRTALADSLFSDEELEALRREVRQAVSEAVTSPTPPSAGRTSLGQQRATPPRGPERKPDRGPQRGPKPRAGASGPSRAAFGQRPSFGRIDWSRPGVLAGLAAALLVGVVAIWFFFIRPAGDAAPAGTASDGGAVASDTVTSADASDTASDTAPLDSGATATGGGATLSGDAQPLYDLWRDRVAADHPAPGGLDAPLRERFGCWFSGSARDDLAEAVREAEAAAGPTALENRLRTVFPLCIGDDAVGQGANAAVYAAQAAAQQALDRRAARGWAGCRQAPDPAPDLAAFRADGIRGPGTYAVLDALATCRGMGRAVSFDGSSDVTDYLFVLYLALADLEGTA